ncbi:MULTISPECIES: signal peptidase I [Bradyrhizobium]|uniref:Signal peptidase I n=1 Tax=Bradyrhizobium aeschynomenes TaxID=2734909 RepID=A0ABX2CI40_9BRAD|nr:MULTISPECIES: signal peptidase I [Bradyrhizobium]NPU10608.1 signal peptidase I [Bradyrhizobium aeschynomenes]NPU66967.1 signal peptidase I [Bradyrhizobium aeschynomenes]
MAKNVVLPAIVLAIIGIALVVLAVVAISLFALPGWIGLVALGAWLIIACIYVLLVPKPEQNTDPLAGILDDPAERSPVIDRLLAVALSIVLFLAFRSLAFQAEVVAGHSMLPGFRDGQVFVISKFAYGYGRYSFPLGLVDFEGRLLGKTPGLGDVIVYRNVETDQDAISRVMGKENDQIELSNGTLRINGKPAQVEDGEQMNPNVRRETLPNGVDYPIRSNPSLSNGRTYRVPAGNVLVMGDNRQLAAPTVVPLKTVIGRVAFQLR